VISETPSGGACHRHCLSALSAAFTKRMIEGAVEE
jgi:hypothetical protein